MTLVIRDYNASDERAVSKLSADAFFDDPAYTHTFPKRRRVALQFIFSRLFRMRLGCTEKYMKVMTSDNEIIGVIAGGPSTNRFSTFDYVKNGLALMPFRFGFGVTWRMLKSDDEIGALLNHARDLGEYTYISELAVAPDHQGKGVGGQLLFEHLKGRSERVVLIATKLDNVEWYENRGFMVHKKMIISESFPVWLMFFEATKS